MGAQEPQNKRPKAFSGAKCQRAECGSHLPRERGRGSVRRFCSVRCRRLAWTRAPLDETAMLPGGEEKTVSLRNAKAKGTRAEHRTIRLLESLGYACTRAAASLGAWDIIGIGSTDVVLVQCKTRDWPGTVEMELLRGFAAPPHCRKLVHRYRDGVRLPDVREL